MRCQVKRKIRRDEGDQDHWKSTEDEEVPDEDGEIEEEKTVDSIEAHSDDEYHCENVTRFRLVECGDSHTLAVDDNGVLYAWGCGDSGRTGLYWQKDRLSCDVFSAEVVESITPLPEVEKLEEDAETAEGENASLSGGSTVSALSSGIRIKTSRGSIAAGGAHSAVIGQDGTCYTFGSNKFGQLGRELEKDGDDGALPLLEAGKKTPQVVKRYLEKSKEVKEIAANGESYTPLPRSTTLHLCGTIPKPVDFKGLPVSRVSCGDSHTAAIVGEVGSATAELWTWGRGESYRLGHGSKEDERRPRRVEGLDEKRVVDVSCGSSHTVVVCAEGDVYAWGQNDSGQCGLPPYSQAIMEKLRDCLIKGKGGDKSSIPMPEDVKRPQKVSFPQEETRADATIETARALLEDDDIAKRLQGLRYLDQLASKEQKKGAAKVVEEKAAGDPGAPVSPRSPRNDLTSRSMTLTHHSSQHNKTFRSSVGKTHELLQSSRSLLLTSRSREHRIFQVACGTCHTLVLLDSTLWLLGSGLDMTSRESNVFVDEKIIKGKKVSEVKTVDCFLPRRLETLLSDAAEVSCSYNVHEPDGFWKPIETFRKVEERMILDEDGKPVDSEKIEHHVLKISYQGDLGILPGDFVAFKGPLAPQGLTIESRSTGPFFSILGVRKDKRGRPIPGMMPEDADCWHEKFTPEVSKGGGTFFIEAPSDVLKPNRKGNLTAEALVEWMNRRVTTSNEENVLVCKVTS